jgi:hypothetical protein
MKMIGQEENSTEYNAPMLREMLREYFRWVGRSRHPRMLGFRLGVGICVVALVVGIVWQIGIWVWMLIQIVIG